MTELFPHQRVTTRATYVICYSLFYPLRQVWKGFSPQNELLSCGLWIHQLLGHAGCCCDGWGSCTPIFPFTFTAGECWSLQIFSLLPPSLLPSCLCPCLQCSKAGSPQSMVSQPMIPIQTHTSTIAPLNIHEHLFGLGQGDWVEGFMRERGAARWQSWLERCRKDVLPECVVDGEILLWNNLKMSGMMEG